MDQDATDATDRTADVISFLSRRRVTSEASFLLPHLRAGDKVLDCGCGAGRITRELAHAVGPSGQVVGVDLLIEPSDAAFAPATETHGAIRFQAADVGALPFADASFDVVFAHVLFGHLDMPVAAAREIMRVLRPGGLIAMRSPDWGGFLPDPQGRNVAHAVRSYQAKSTGARGAVLTAQRLSRLLRRSGAERVEPSSSCEIYQMDGVSLDYLARRMDAMDPRAADALRTWSCDPDAMFAHVWSEALGRKPAA
jgi:ubiquinone/menaquinone biosynthesis C-methylase UbiE